MAAPTRPDGTAAIAAKKPSFYEAIAIYESGVRALQRHDFEAGAQHFRGVIERYPEERELLERARLYLRVCERETANRPSAPKTAQELIYAATVALNAGQREAALTHLRQVLQDDPQSDHAHYIMAVALSESGDRTSALHHLRQSLALNPDNRSLARQDADLGSLREMDEFRQIVAAAEAAARRKPRGRRG